MGSKHLVQGTIFPKKTSNKWRLYSQIFCPFAERVRIVLNIKRIPYETININLTDKPDWFLEINPKGLVPVLDTGKEILTESLDICNFIEENHPEPPLFNPQNINEDKNVINQTLQPIILEFHRGIRSILKAREVQLQEHFNVMVPHLNNLQNVLVKQGKFFGGNEQPNMVDYMIWPWAERIDVLKLIFGEQLPKAQSFPHLEKWIVEMLKDKAVQEVFIPTKLHYKLFQAYTNGGIVDYDAVYASRSNL